MAKEKAVLASTPRPKPTPPVKGTPIARSTGMMSASQLKENAAGTRVVPVTDQPK